MQFAELTIFALEHAESYATQSRDLGTYAGDRRAVALCRVKAILELDLAHTKGGWKKANQQ